MQQNIIKNSYIVYMYKYFYILNSKQCKTEFKKTKVLNRYLHKEYIQMTGKNMKTHSPLNYVISHQENKNSNKLDIYLLDGQHQADTNANQLKL